MVDEATQCQSTSYGKGATRQRILEAATEVFSEKGYHGAAVDDIVRESQTSKGSFYFHFPSKQDIFFALVDRLASSLTRSAEDGDAPGQHINEVLAKLGYAEPHIVRLRQQNVIGAR